MRILSPLCISLCCLTSLAYAHESATHLEADSSPVSDNALDYDRLSKLNFGYVLYQRADQLRKTGVIADARAMAEKAATTVAEVAGTNSPDHAYCVNLLAMIDIQEELFDSAEKRLEQLLIAEVNWPINPKALSISVSYRGNLALVKRRVGKLNEAEAQYTALIDELEQYSNRVNAASFTIALAHVEMDFNPPRIDDARKHVDAALNTLEQQLAEDDRSVIAALSAKARLASLCGEHADAVKQYGDCVVRLQRVAGTNSFDLADLLCRFADAQAEAGKFDDASKSLERAIAIKKDCLGNDHPSIISIRKIMAKNEPSIH